MSSKKRLDIMVDIETLGIDIDSTIIQLAAIAFDITTGEFKEFFNEYANIDKNKKVKVNGSTLKWWIKTNPKLLNEILTAQNQSSEVVIEKFYNWIKDLQKTHSIYIWGNGIGFDLAMIKHAILELGLNYPIGYRNERDVRTILELASIKSGKTEKEIRDTVKLNGVAHDAFYDCKYQINYVSRCFKYLTKGEKNENNA